MAKIEAILTRLLDATGASRGTLRADDPARGWQADTPAMEVLRHGAPTMMNDASVNHRAAGSIQWIIKTGAILKQEDLTKVEANPPWQLMQVFKARSQMVGPVFKGDWVYGWVSAHDVTGPRPWTETDEAAMRTAIADIGALVL
ncbi:GAF domain-containing protein [Aquabacter cavernae]|uniref:GAF domain-containing protein n=1 Tax=Aquabacter cavernae TaxID=2496029 RepID=UPI0013E0DDDC|nr:GAF domain-containing protein [Aquabacter cavernae]